MKIDYIFLLPDETKGSPVLFINEGDFPISWRGVAYANADDLELGILKYTNNYRRLDHRDLRDWFPPIPTTHELNILALRSCFVSAAEQYIVYLTLIECEVKGTRLYLNFQQQDRAEIVDYLIYSAIHVSESSNPFINEMIDLGILNWMEIREDP